jgi:hypothetical protein
VTHISKHVGWINRAKDYRTEKNDIQGGFDTTEIVDKDKGITKKEKSTKQNCHSLNITGLGNSGDHTVGGSYIDMGISSCISTHIKEFGRLDRFTNVFPWEYILYNFHASL